MLQGRNTSKTKTAVAQEKVLALLLFFPLPLQIFRSPKIGLMGYTNPLEQVLGWGVGGGAAVKGERAAIYSSCRMFEPTQSEDGKIGTLFQFLTAIAPYKAFQLKETLWSYC